MTNCPVEECTDVKEIKASLRRWGGIIVLILLAIGGPSLYTWAKSLAIDDLKKDSKAHERRLIVIEVQYENIDAKLEDIMELLRKQSEHEK